MNTRNSYSNQEFETFLTHEMNNLEEHALADTKANAGRGIPALEDAVPLTFEYCHLRFQTLLDKNYRLHNAQGIVYETAIHGEGVDDQVHELENKLREAIKRQINATDALKRAVLPFKPISQNKLRLAITSICLFEAGLFLPAGEGMGFSLLEAGIGAALLAVILYYYADIIPKWIDKGKTVRARILIALGIFIFTTSFFWYLSTYRAAYYQAQGAGSGLNITAMPFTVVSVFLMLVAVSVKYYYRPTDAQVQAMEIYNGLQQEKTEADMEVTQLEEAIASLKSEKGLVKTQNAGQLLYGKDLEDWIITTAESCYARSRDTNLQYRTDGITPTCYRSPYYPFTFRRYFTIKQSIQ